MKLRSFSLFFLIVLYLFLFVRFSTHKQPKDIAGRIGKALVELQEDQLQYTKQLIDDFIEIIENDSTLDSFDRLQQEAQINELLFFILQDDSLLYWSSNRIDYTDLTSLDLQTKSSLIEIHQNWFNIVRLERNDFILYSLKQIYFHYPIQNKYLKDGFDETLFPFAETYFITTDSIESIPVFYKDDGLAFYITVNSQLIKADTEKKSVILLLILLTLLTLLYRMISDGYVWLSKKSGFTENISILAIVDILIIQIVIRIFGKYFLNVDNELFKPVTFSSGLLFPSLGYLILHVHAILHMALIFFKSKIGFKQKPKNSINIFLLIIYLVAFQVFVLGSITTVLHLFSNSGISLSYAEMYALNIGSYAILLIAVVLHFAMLLIAVGFYLRTKTISVSPGLKHLISGIILILTGIGIYFSNFTTILWVAIFYILLFYFVLDRLPSKIPEILGKTFYFYLLVFLSAFMLTYLIYSINEETESNELQLAAHKLAQESDPMFEFLFPEVLAQIESDEEVKILLQSSAEDNETEKIYSHIETKYFSGFFEKYSVEQTLCHEGQTLLIQPGNYTVSCEEFFRQLIENHGKEVIPARLFLIDDNIEGFYYLSVIPLSYFEHQHEISSTLYIEFYFKYVSEGLGYPDLLIDQSKQFIQDFASYSFANYRDGVLSYKFGSFFYPGILDQLPYQSGHTFDFDGFTHLYQQVSKHKVLIISRKTKNILNAISPFSFFFLTLLGITAWVYVRLRLKNDSVSLADVSFRFKFQMIVVASLFISFAFIGLSSTYFLSNIYTTKNKDFLIEKTKSVAIELAQQISTQNSQEDEAFDYAHQLVMNLSHIYFTDINLFHTDGELLASSRPEIFKQRLLSARMDPVAYQEVHRKKKIFFLHEENIGSSSYMSSYIPLISDTGETIAYINLPFFALEKELKAEISALIFSYTNVFLFLAAIAISIALYFSRRLTQPLEMIQEKMKLVRIDKLNEKIKWRSRDELGQLVDQYNKLLDQLQESAELLARSERELAWREMAKQVAHEIKNPLTPMRLSIQYLERAWQENDPDIDEKIKNTTQTIINQIDTLSTIASAFSDFANMPVSTPTPQLVSEIIAETIMLFDKIDTISFRFIDHTHGKAMVNIDQDSFRRALTNLIKNSIQAIGKKKDGKIDFELSIHDQSCYIVISDNGKGMSSDEAAKVFTPNFTTKSSGMGLGLTMVKNIVHTAGGSISFSTEPDKGTMFTIVLPTVTSTQP